LLALQEEDKFLLGQLDFLGDDSSYLLVVYLLVDCNKVGPLLAVSQIDMDLLR
jgi:hypothetical protein